MKHPREYKDKRVVILGMAKSGQAVAKVFTRFGADVIVNDMKSRELCPEADELERLGVTVICGGHPPDLMSEETSLVVKNPGIPYSVQPIQHALSLGIEIVTEVEVAFHITRSPMIGITGSNGKTTTTSWIGRMLHEGGKSPVVCGNIGTPLCEAAEHSEDEDMLVVELSSFQLEGIVDFHPQISCLLNIYETHLDYHGDLDHYIKAKERLFHNQTEQDVAVLNMDDETCINITGRIRAKILPFSYKKRLPMGVYVDEYDKANDNDKTKYIVYNDGSGGLHAITPINELAIPGAHNVENALAATAVAIAAGVPLAAIDKALRNFEAVEHRLEFVKEFRGVKFYNDSKATNPAATIKALQSFDRPIVWIGGGLDRGSDYMELLPWFREKVKAIVTIGETSEKIQRVGVKAGLKKQKAVYTAKSDKLDPQVATDAMRQAVEVAVSFADEGDIVLLSPACASWDMYRSYEVRGRMFKESVHNL